MVDLQFPGSGGDFGIEERGALGDEAVIGGWVGDADGRRTAVNVLLVRASVFTELPYRASDFVPERRDVHDEVHELLAAAADVARTVVRDYLESARVNHGQYWLGLSLDRPRTSWLTEVFEADTGERIPTGYHDPLGLVVLGFDAALDQAGHRAAIQSASGQSSPNLPETLLADAEHLAWSSDPPQAAIAVLLGAVACEIKIKQTLLAVAADDVQIVLRWALDNPRDVSQQAAGLFDKTAEAVTGRSMRLEDKALFKRVTTLFERRNDVAHRGATALEAELVDDLLGAAKDAFGWCDRLSAAGQG